MSVTAVNIICIMNSFREYVEEEKLTWSHELIKYTALVLFRKGNLQKLCNKTDNWTVPKIIKNKFICNGIMSWILFLKRQKKLFTNYNHRVTYLHSWYSIILHSESLIIYWLKVSSIFYILKIDSKQSITNLPWKYL